MMPLISMDRFKKKVNGVVSACDIRIPEGSTRNATFITIEWVLPRGVVVKDLNGIVSEYVPGIEVVAVAVPIIFVAQW